MAYQFANNFTQTLAATLSETGTTLELDGGGEALEGVTPQNVIPLTLVRLENQEEVGREIVYVTGVSENSATVRRNEEGTASPAGGWPAGTQVECRMTAGAVAAVGEAGYELIMGAEAEATGDYSMAIGPGCVSAGFYGLSIGGWATAQGSHSIAIGRGAAVGGELGTAVGRGSGVSGYGAVALGFSSFSNGERGFGASGGSARGDFSISIGPSSQVWEGRGIALGQDSYSSADPADTAVAIGPDAKAYTRGVTIGGSAPGAGFAESPNGSVSIGVGANCTGLTCAVSIGYKAKNTLDGGFRSVGVPYLPEEPEDLAPFSPPNAASNASMQVVISTTDLDLTDINSFHTIELPEFSSTSQSRDVLFFVDEIDLIAVDVSEVTEAPQIQIGTDANTPANVLAASQVTISSRGSRQKFAASSDEGYAGFYVSLSQAATATRFVGRVVFKGYVVMMPEPAA